LVGHGDGLTAQPSHRVLKIPENFCLMQRQAIDDTLLYGPRDVRILSNESVFDSRIGVVPTKAQYPYFNAL
jgi:hypothetical protein